jgi:MraZ protein
MAGFIGEYHSTVDEKGRFLLPAGLKKQIPAREQKRFVVHRGIEKHLVIYTQKEWDKISAEVNELNLFLAKNREFIRMFNRGASEMELDGTNRLLLPKSLMDYAGIEKDIVLFAYGSRIELWSQRSYEKMLKSDTSGFAKLAEEVMGNRNKGGKDANVS